MTTVKDLKGSHVAQRSDERWLLYMRTAEPGTNATPIQIRGHLAVEDGVAYFRRLADNGSVSAVVGYPLGVIDHFETASVDWTPWMPDWREP